MPLQALPVGYNRANMHVFMAKYYKDKLLTDGYEKPEWITPIQVGAALCKERVAILWFEPLSEDFGAYGRRRTKTCG